MCSTSTDYEVAISKLNLLQNTFYTRLKEQKALHEKIGPLQDLRDGKMQRLQLKFMENYLLRIGITMSDLDKLSVIHISGTKGKGSTSAMCESILRHHGFRTGFFPSPQLVSVREFFRLNGRIVSVETFLKYFNQVYNLLDTSKAHKDDMPQYRQFVSLVAFKMFLDEKVDVAVIEVALGGIFDHTNVLRKVPVVGITSLALEHTFALGNTLTQIAAAKAGIMKPGCEAFTVKQPEEAMKVLKDVANIVMCPLTVVIDYEAYIFPDNCKTLTTINSEGYKMNASLAIQLSHAWMRITKPEFKKLASIPKVVSLIPEEGLVKYVSEETLEALKTFKWPGRCQTLKTDYAQFYLDGAHTKESMKICVDWFKSNTGQEDKVLIFNAKVDKNAEELLKVLVDIPFKSVYFVMSRAAREISLTHDTYRIEDAKELFAVCEKHAATWKKLNDNAANINISSCVGDALEGIKSNCGNETSVLVTGSLHLVGPTLSLLDPTLKTFQIE